MVSKKVTVINQTGLHARPACELVKIAKGFKCDISILFNEKKLNAKSLLSIMTGELACGSGIEVVASGEDEKDCINSIVNFINNVKD